MRPSAIVSVLALAGLSAAQEQYQIDPDTVSDSTRDYWCQQQETQCPLICLQQPGVTTQNTISNDCDSDTLEFKCVCEDNSSPNVTKYTQTMPYFICTQWGTNCVDDCDGDNTCADKCRADHPCGAQEPFKPNKTASATKSASPSQTSGESIPTGFLGASGSSDSEGAAPALLNLASSYSMALGLAATFLGFALL